MTFCVLASWAIIAIVLASGSTGAAKGRPDFIRIAPSDVHWRDMPGGHGAQEAILFGDPDKPGMYVVQVKFPPHLMDLPHWHPNDRFVTVLESLRATSALAHCAGQRVYSLPVRSDRSDRNKENSRSEGIR
jgi:hypothetical protein